MANAEHMGSASICDVEGPSSEFLAEREGEAPAVRVTCGRHTVAPQRFSSVQHSPRPLSVSQQPHRQAVGQAIALPAAGYAVGSALMSFLWASW
ncbi:hypothetical protein PAXRUDRAFT_18530 [Paxillus rubicundulus Ve08.2h10]|uniref:Uncharacterized protein n=1 Tax=Paxillus rubicundulus Ve08.2h10 TaxID=930991 RepID=A0A0D0CXT7_9AGAM|nr:hypothetical protein PAXRUDRAFT_18530 [Paxillus rubicundulus Ve08.2h10]